MPELLDSLPADDPDAIGSRRDLVVINALMFQTRIMAGLMRSHIRPGNLRLLEIGSGDGAFMLAVARKLGRRYGAVELLMLDQINLITPLRIKQFAALGWQVKTVTADVFEWIAREEAGQFDAVFANLFLHHFDGGALSKLLAAMPTLAPVFLATEPRRSRIALWSTWFLRFVGANAVTLHDAAVSVRAGFVGDELSRVWPDGAGQVLTERRVGPFTHVFAAVTSGADR
ncbi:methyltransferase domain-containing protein [Devosia beringensis]|uniref:methyltransferase domain-containing protein n=1 Tax=Devosia beringensis TaxID=2657486 RepID=UPI001E59D1E1|nr:methyltransferase domain-containing protein [Devosia beringensis]